MMRRHSSSRALVSPANVRNELGRTPLHYAAAAGRYDLVVMFCEEFEADVHAKDVHGYTALLRALEADALDVVDYLLHRRASAAGLLTHERNTPLHLLAQSVSREPDSLKLTIFGHFVEQGLDVNALNLKNRSALWLAVLADSPLFVGQLLLHGADPSLPACLHDDDQPMTPLQLARHTGSARTAHILADKLALHTADSSPQQSATELQPSTVDSSVQPSATESAASSAVALVVALHPYAAPRHDVLNLAVGEVIAVRRWLTAEWAEGENRSGARGLFPLPYTTPYSPYCSQLPVSN